MTDDAPYHLAEQVRTACIAAAQAGYEDAAMAGLCGEGALEAAVSAIEKLDLTEIIGSADDNANLTDT